MPQAKSQSNRVIVTTAVPLSAQQRAIVLEIVTKKLGGGVQIEESVDSSVVGGIKLQLDGKEYDVTVKGTLQRLKPQLPLVQVTTAVALNAAQRQKLLKALANKFGPVDFHEVVDPSVLGGLKIRIGSVEHDHTLAAKLDQLAKQLRHSLPSITA